MDSCHLVAPDVSAENAEKEAERMLNWLKQQGIIDPDYQLIEDDEVIYRPTPEYKQPILYIIDDKIVPTQLPEHILKTISPLPLNVPYFMQVEMVLVSTALFVKTNKATKVKIGAML